MDRKGKELKNNWARFHLHLSLNKEPFGTSQLTVVKYFFEKTRLKFIIQSTLRYTTASGGIKHVQSQNRHPIKTLDVGKSLEKHNITGEFTSRSTNKIVFKITNLTTLLRRHVGVKQQT